MSCAAGHEVFVEEMLLQCCLGVPKQLSEPAAGKTSTGISTGVTSTGIFDSCKQAAEQRFKVKLCALRAGSRKLFLLNPEPCQNCTSDQGI